MCSNCHSTVDVRWKFGIIKMRSEKKYRGLHSSSSMVQMQISDAYHNQGSSCREVDNSAESAYDEAYAVENYV